VFRKWFSVLFVISLLAGCAVLGPARIEVENAKVLEAKVSGISAGDLNFSCICDVPTAQTSTPVFMTIHNKGGETDRLMKVETEQAVKIELRRGSETGDLSAAEPVETVEIPALSTIEFRDGKYAMILTGVKEDIKPGDPVKLTLYFEKSGAIEIIAETQER